MYRLHFQTGAHAGRTLAVRQGGIVIGRGEGCDLALEGDGEVAARHARLEENAAGVFLCGLDAAWPVRCNGEAVEGSRCLRDGDVIGIGATEMVFRKGGAEKARGRLKVSHGVIQPLAAVFTAGLVAVELLLLQYTIVGPYEVVASPSDVEDQAKAEVIRAQEAEDEQKEKAENAEAKAAAMALPGSTGGGEAAGAGAEAGADPASATAAALEMLESADFEPASAETDLATLPPISAADPRIADAQRLLAQADAAAQFADYAEAERLLQQLHKAAPGFLPAYEEHAKVLEMQGKFQDSQIRWRQLRGLSKEGSAFRGRAEEGLQRLEGLLAARKSGQGRGAGGGADGVRLAEPEVVRLPDGADADVVEMRVLRTAVELDAHAAAAVPPGTALRLDIAFFDRRPDGTVERSVALTQGSPVALQVPGRLPARLEVDNFTYVVTRGMKPRRGNAEYYGCRMRLYAGDRLLAEQAKPRKLLTEVP